MRHIIYLLLVFPFIILADSVEVVQTQTQDSRIKNEEKRSENLTKDVYEKDRPRGSVFLSSNGHKPQFLCSVRTGFAIQRG